ncbi:MAG: S26 family signal peptidase [Candidatus Aenigmatarchaeota archaeon]
MKKEKYNTLIFIIAITTTFIIVMLLSAIKEDKVLTHTTIKLDKSEIIIPDNTTIEYTFDISKCPSDNEIIFEHPAYKNLGKEYINKIILENKTCNSTTCYIFVVYKLSGKSMQPTLNEGYNTILYFKHDNIEYNEGDIIIYHTSYIKENENYIHRIVGKCKNTKNETMYIVKGDNNNVFELVKKESIEGVLVDYDKK